MKRRSIYRIKEALGHQPTDAVQTMEAVTLDPADAELSGVREVPPRCCSGARPTRMAFRSNTRWTSIARDRTSFRICLGLLEKTCPARAADGPGHVLQGCQASPDTAEDAQRLSRA